MSVGVGVASVVERAAEQQEAEAVLHAVEEFEVERARGFKLELEAVGVAVLMAGLAR